MRVRAQQRGNRKRAKEYLFVAGLMQSKFSKVWANKVSGNKQGKQGALAPRQAARP